MSYSEKSDINKEYFDVIIKKLDKVDNFEKLLVNAQKDIQELKDASKEQLQGLKEELKDASKEQLQGLKEELKDASKEQLRELKDNLASKEQLQELKYSLERNKNHADNTFRLLQGRMTDMQNQAREPIRRERYYLNQVSSGAGHNTYDDDDDSMIDYPPYR